MKCFKFLLMILLSAIIQIESVSGQQPGKSNAIYSGIPWYDQNGNVVRAN